MRRWLVLCATCVSLQAVNARSATADDLVVLPSTLPAPLVAKLSTDLGAGKKFLLAGKPQAHSATIAEAATLLPVGLFATAPMVLVARGDLTAAEGEAAIADLKSKGAALRIAHDGEGSASGRCAKALESQLKSSWINVVSSQRAPADSLAESAADIACLEAPRALPLLKAGLVIGLAVAGEERLASLWDVPTGTEVGLPLFTEMVWYGLYAASTVAAAPALNKALQAHLDSEANAQALLDIGLTPFPLTHRSNEAHAAFLAERAE